MIRLAVSLGESFACARCDVFIGALQTFPLSLSSWKTTEALPESQGYLLLCLINMHVFGTCVGSAGMLSSISFFIYMRLGGVTYGASWLSWIGIFIKPCELCIGLLRTPRATVDPARTLNCFPLGGMIHRLVKTYMCAVCCRNSCACNPRECLGILWLTSHKVTLIFIFVFIEEF